MTCHMFISPTCLWLLITSRSGTKQLSVLIMTPQKFVVVKLSEALEPGKNPYVVVPSFWVKINDDDSVVVPYPSADQLPAGFERIINCQPALAEWKEYSGAVEREAGESLVGLPYSNSIFDHHPGRFNRSLTCFRHIWSWLALRKTLRLGAVGRRSFDALEARQSWVDRKTWTSASCDYNLSRVVTLLEL